MVCFRVWAASCSSAAARPFTEDFVETYQRAFNKSLVDFLPELYWELPAGRVSAVRYRYHDHVAERFAEAHAATLGA